MWATTASICRASSTPTRRTRSNGFARPSPTGEERCSTIPQTRLITATSPRAERVPVHYNGLQARYEQRFVDGLTLLNSFSWQHALDNASATLDANTPSPQDGNNLNADYGQSDYNLPIANVTSFVYDLPVGKGQHFLPASSSLVNAIVGGWQISGINTVQGGTPFNLSYGPAGANLVSPMLTQNWRGSNTYRPNLIPGAHYTQGKVQNSSGYIQYVNNSALTLPATYSSYTSSSVNTLSSPFGSLPKNYGRTMPFYETDLDFNKKFNTPIERMKVEFRSEFYNIFNHTNLYMPGGNGGGTVTGTDGHCRRSPAAAAAPSPAPSSRALFSSA